MTIAQKAAAANNPKSSSRPSGWGQSKDSSCHYVQTEYVDGRVVQRWHPCRCLDCSYCGPRKKEADLSRAMKLFAKEAADISVVLVPSWKVDHLRKYAARRDQPIMSVPVEEDRNAIFSPYPFEGSHVATEEETRRIFLLRISRRKLTATGRWSKKSTPPENRPPEKQPVVLSKEFVSPKAFENVAKRLGAKLRYTDLETYFEDEWKHGPEKYKKWLVEEETRIRRERLKARGFGWARRLAA